MTLVHTGGSAKLGPVERVWRRIAVHDTVGAAEASFSFAGMNGDADVVYQIRGRWKKAGATDNVLLVQPNGDSGANYGEQIQGLGNTTRDDFNDTTRAGLFLAYFGANTSEGPVFMELQAKTGFKRTGWFRGGESTGASNFKDYGGTVAWNDSTTPITSLTVAFAGGAAAIDVGSHFELWALRPGSA